MIFVVFMSLLLSFVISYFSWEFWTDILSRIFLVCVVIFCLGLDASERKIISAFVKQKIQKT
ncbi:putative membrane protein [Bacteroides fragilis str. S6L5]|nr:putative membrane protein [Bacteroides fragilis str. S6L5]